MTIKHISVVCSGNICRSPYAEHKLRQLLEEQGDTHLRVSSAGTLGIQGSGAHSYTISVGQERGVDCSQHLSQGISRAYIDDTDLLLCMSRSHVNELRELFPDYRDRVLLLGSFPQWHLDGPEIGDPIGYPPERFHEVFAQIDAQLDRVLKLLADQIRQHPDPHTNT